MFRVDIKALKRCSRQLHSDSGSLLKDQRRIREVIDDLSVLGNMREVIETLESIASEVGNEAKGVETLSEAADRIAFKYETAEMRVLEVAENSSVDIPSVNVKFGDYRNTKDMNPGVRDTFDDIDKLIN